MNNRRIQKEKDDRLADFTDRLLAGEIEQDAVSRGSDPELAQMQETLRRMRQAFPPQVTDAAMQNRMRARLTTEWRRNSFPVRDVKRNFIPARRTWSLALAVSAIAIFVLLVTFLPIEQTGISGTAGIGAAWIPFAIFIIVIAVLIFWQLRKK